MNKGETTVSVDIMQQSNLKYDIQPESLLWCLLMQCEKM